jgi:GxxExxY protein
MHEGLTREILRVFYEVYNELGHGFLESVYEQAMGVAMTDAGLDVVRQAPIGVWFRGRSVGEFRIDMLVNRLVIVEFKAARSIDPSHEAQLLNYLRATPVEVGLILNFGVKPEFRRLVFENSRKPGLNPRPSAEIRG